MSPTLPSVYIHTVKLPVVPKTGDYSNNQPIHLLKVSPPYSDIRMLAGGSLLSSTSVNVISNTNAPIAKPTNTATDVTPVTSEITATDVTPVTSEITANMTPVMSNMTPVMNKIRTNVTPVTRAVLLKDPNGPKCDTQSCLNDPNGRKKEADGRKNDLQLPNYHKSHDIFRIFRRPNFRRLRQLPKLVPTMVETAPYPPDSTGASAPPGRGTVPPAQDTSAEEFSTTTASTASTAPPNDDTGPASAFRSPDDPRQTAEFLPGLRTSRVQRLLVSGRELEKLRGMLPKHSPAFSSTTFPRKVSPASKRHMTFRCVPSSSRNDSTLSR